MFSLKQKHSSKAKEKSKTQAFHMHSKAKQYSNPLAIHRSTFINKMHK
jgi:hypothetical protein